MIWHKNQLSTYFVLLADLGLTDGERIVADVEYLLVVLAPTGVTSVGGDKDLWFNVADPGDDALDNDEVADLVGFELADGQEGHFLEVGEDY